ncbi:DUF6955 family protein [Sulfolobus acidocaldarius]|uniref:Conserved protein n=4 Tax=Sulfolobus acidocaldarius TaxID=2285 RepID=Q4J6U1_SULAC|nr:hypothetical protein [Sulfolobus acidocaldarius]AAY81490.1 conserved protein [Sulfolobus acidocaldarius DSM 639]AGE72095.1 hypothetical protein SacN8_10745 [Sulfolobus acidocaldarius N8]AGE74412.1 hypothetical protein SacRon12I_10990 [Sulfolobus acidocaldarius Ron12/I]ALU29727.1 hypothetical protein ATY89_07080 [Sulfolobus acidocaldarius]ALU32461.1 hypothetical protein ATZ20_10100 [Sulfolobus acidocaldarius]
MKVYIWLSEEVAKKLEDLGLRYGKEVLGGMKRLEIEVEEEIVKRIVEVFPNAKVDRSTTNSIELLPKHFKEKVIQLLLNRGTDPKDALIEALNIYAKQKQS